MSRFLSILFLVLPFMTRSQDLLVNGGFEEENICTEYKINCAPEAWISNTSGFNNYFKDANRAFEGEHCMAVEAGRTNKPFERTFIRSQLLCALQKGRVYRLVFYIKSPHAILDSAGVYFGLIDPLLERKPIHRLSASVYFGDTHQFRRDSNWQKVSIDYRANGEEQYITIANFARNDINGATGIYLESHFFFFVDNVSLHPVDPGESLCDGWKETKEEIYEQNERHEFLQRSIKYRRNQGPLRLPLKPTKLVVADTMIMPDLLFATGRSELQQYSHAFLDSFCRSLRGKTIDSLIIEGHTDNAGPVVLNDTLSAGRAMAVRAHLQQCGYFFRVPVVTRAWGSRRPVAPNDNPAGRRQNRRVVLLVYLRE